MNRRTFITAALGTAAFITLPMSAIAETVGGTAHDFVPEGTTEDLEVVAYKAVHSDKVVAIIRNNTKDAIGITEVAGVARKDGGLVGVGDISEVGPYLVESGGFAIAHVLFGDTKIEEDWEFEFTIEYEEPSEPRFLDLDIDESAASGSDVIGILKNNHDEAVRGPFTLVGVAFDAKGEIIGDFVEYISSDGIESGDTKAFKTNRNGSTEAFDSFLIAVTGYTF